MDDDDNQAIEGWLYEQAETVRLSEGASVKRSHVSCAQDCSCCEQILKAREETQDLHKQFELFLRRHKVLPRWESNPGLLGEGQVF